MKQPGFKPAPIWNVSTRAPTPCRSILSTDTDSMYKALKFINKGDEFIFMQRSYSRTEWAKNGKTEKRGVCILVPLSFASLMSLEKGVVT